MTLIERIVGILIVVTSAVVVGDALLSLMIAGLYLVYSIFAFSTRGYLE